MASGNFGQVYGRWSDKTFRSKMIEILQGLPVVPPESVDQSFCSGEIDSVLSPLFDESEFSWNIFPEEASASEMTTRGKRMKVMSVELAMPRELAYQNKAEIVRKGTPNDFQASPSTGQGAFLMRKTVGVKREASSDNFPFQKRQPREPCPSLIAKPPFLKAELPLYFCKECQVPCSSKFNLWQHHQGKKHRDTLDRLKVGVKIGKIGTEPITCQVCKIQCMNELCYKEHLKGKKHADCIQAIYNTKAVKIVWEEEMMADWGDCTRTCFLDLVGN